VLGTTGILKSIVKNAPTVKKVVITSSFAAIINRAKGFWPEHTYSEADWNPTTLKESLENAVNGYYGSKTLAEQAAWKFIDEEKPGFALTTVAPPMVYGPVKQKVESLDHVNTSTTLQRDLLLGKFKNKDIPDMSVPLWVDVRDLALVHTLAMENRETDGQRIFTTAGHYTNRELVEIIRNNFPEYADRLPAKDAKGGDLAETGVYEINNSRVKQLLKQDFISFEQSTIDLVKTLKELGA
jgi:nucleoside-diphosphate-sugar epimerase